MRPTMQPTYDEQEIRRAVMALFRNADGERGYRLELRSPQEENLGGWIEVAAADRVIQALEWGRK